MVQGVDGPPWKRRPLLRLLARAIFGVSGWHHEGQPPSMPRCVILAAPHTSNWDGFMMLVSSFLFDVKLSWFVKDNLFFWPLGTVLRWFGGIPIDRRARHNLVEIMAERIRQAPVLHVAIPPEGTRAWRPHWKTGFYHIAQQAQVPILFGYVDFRRKTVGLGPCLVPTGDMEADFRIIADFYKDITARHPARVGPIAPPPAT